MAITYWNESVEKEMEMVTSQDVGINSFKVFMAYKDVFMLRDNEIIECFKVSGRTFDLFLSVSACTPYMWTCKVSTFLGVYSQVVQPK